MKIIIHIVVTALALLIVAEFVPGITISSFYVACIVALVLGVLNIFVKPILVILTLPVTLLTLGLFIFVINAGLFMFAASFVEGFAVTGFIPALIGSVLTSIVSTVALKVLN
jgi:putative membrane protein